MGRLRQLRHEVTGRARYWGTHAITGMTPDQRHSWSRRLRASGPGRAALEQASAWYGRAPIGIAAGPAAGLFVSTEHLPLHHAHAGLVARGTLEPSVQEALRRTVAPGDVVYDVGANIGYFTLAAARLVGPRGRVVAFEPVPWCAQAVARNIELNDLAQAEVRPVAVGERSGRARLCVVEEASWSHLDSTGRHADTREEIDVDVVSVDELVAAGDVPPPDVLKVDTEGAELQVIAGMRETIARHRPRIVCELHDTNRRFAELMDAIGYRATNLDGPAAVADGAPGIHVLAEPRG